MPSFEGSFAQIPVVTPALAAQSSLRRQRKLVCVRSAGVTTALFGQGLRREKAREARAEPAEKARALGRSPRIATAAAATRNPLARWGKTGYPFAVQEQAGTTRSRPQGHPGS